MLYIQAARVLVLVAALVDVGSAVPSAEVFLSIQNPDGLTKDDCTKEITHPELTNNVPAPVYTVLNALSRQCAKDGYGEDVAIANDFHLIGIEPEARLLEEAEVQDERELQTASNDENCPEHCEPSNCYICCIVYRPSCPILCSYSSCQSRRTRDLEDGGFKDTIVEGRRLSYETSIAAQCKGDYKYVARILQHEFQNNCLGNWPSVEVYATVS